MFNPVAFGLPHNKKDMNKIKPSKLRHVGSLLPSQYTVYRENRDNKVQLNGVGWGSGNTIRLPSLKRSKRTWRNFYKHFPMMLECDFIKNRVIKKKKI